MGEIDTPEKIVSNAICELHLAIQFFENVTQNISKLIFPVTSSSLDGVEVQLTNWQEKKCDGWENCVKTAAGNLVRSATMKGLIAIYEERDEIKKTVNFQNEISRSAFWEGMEILRHMRNCYAHGPYMPRWKIHCGCQKCKPSKTFEGIKNVLCSLFCGTSKRSPQKHCSKRKYEVNYKYSITIENGSTKKRSVQVVLNATNLDGKRFEDGMIGYPQYLNLLQYLADEIRFGTTPVYAATQE